jgi:hypothetical protein
MAQDVSVTASFDLVRFEVCLPLVVKLRLVGLAGKVP